jgi:hypothetical protein
MIDIAGGRRSLTASWWLLVPAFAVLVVRLSYERACASPYELLPAVMSKAQSALPIAVLYLGAHVWAGGAYLLTVRETGSLLPSIAAARRIWGTQWPKIVFTVAVLALEYLPISLWRLVGKTVLPCGR